MKRILLVAATAITLLSFPTTYAGILSMPAKVVTKTPTFALTLTGLDLAAMAVIPLNKYFEMASHDPDGAQAYLSKHPVQRNVIRMKTFKALRHAESHQDYQHIHDSAVDYLGFSGLPAYEGTDLDTSIPGYESDTMDHTPMINPIRDARPDDIILVNPITKIKINVTMEYPTEDIRNWKDYLIIVKGSITLGRNIEKAGQVKPKNVAAHHIIPFSAPGANEARDIWTNKHKCNQDIDSADNGVFLPNIPNHPTLSHAIVHRGPHTKLYYSKINRDIKAAYDHGGCDSVHEMVDIIRNKLLNGKNRNWDNVL